MTRKKIYTTDKPGYEAVKAYREANRIVRVPLDMPSDEAGALRAYCSERGLSVAGFIRSLIREAIQASTPPLGDMGKVPGPNESRE